MRETALERQARIDREARERVAAEDAVAETAVETVRIRVAAAEYKGRVSRARKRVVETRLAAGLKKGQWSKGYAPCGTASAYGRHQRWGEEPCGPCREAYREYSRLKSRRYRRRVAERQAADG